GARAAAPQLGQERAVPVTDPRRALGVYRDRALSGGQRRYGPVQARYRGHQRRRPVPWLKQGDRRVRWRCRGLAVRRRGLAVRRRGLAVRRRGPAVWARGRRAVGGGLALWACGVMYPWRAAPGYWPAARHGFRRRLAGRSALTPAASGASPAAAHIVPHHAAMWPARPSWAPSSPGSAAGSACSGDQEARSSKPVARGSARLAPNPSVTTRVTVPLGSA